MHAHITAFGLPSFIIEIGDVNDPDDIIKDAEATVSAIVGHEMNYCIDFVIDNFTDLCEELLPF